MTPHSKEEVTPQNNEECMICFAELTDKIEDIYILDCDHRFHVVCLNSWYSRPGCNYKCPSCNIQREIINIEYSTKVFDDEELKNKNKKCFKCVIS